MTHFAVLLPMLDEAPCLPRVLPGLAQVLRGLGLARARMIACDNGSRDGTPEIAAGLGAEVCHAPARGYGNALRAGLRHLAPDPPDLLAILDADGASDPRDLPRLLAPILEGRADLVLGDRTGLAEPGALTRAQRAGNAVATRVISWRTGLRTRDLGPFRAIRHEALLRLGMVDPTWGWNVEMHLKAARAGLRVLELPVAYGLRVGGQPKISGTWRGAVRAGARMAQACWRYA
jgi:glycosyltransferase involved in cell wall biosynthesis